jgi:hypothetical protein
VTVPQHDFGGMQQVCGIKSRGRAIARRGDHEPDEQMNGPAHGGPRGAAAFQGGDETEGAQIGGCRRQARQVCRQLKNLR